MPLRRTLVVARATVFCHALRHRQSEISRCVLTDLARKCFRGCGRARSALGNDVKLCVLRRLFGSNVECS